MGDFKSDADHEHETGLIANAVRQGVALARLDMKAVTDAEIDAKVDRKLDKFKLWMAGSLVLHLLPIIGLAVAFGQFSGRVETKLETLDGATAIDLNRRFTEVERRVSQLEAYHRQGGR